MTQGVKLGPPSQWSAGQTHRRRVAGEARDGGGIRNSSSGDQIDGGGRLRGAGACARRVVAVGDAGMAENVTGDDLGGRGSSGEVGNGAVGHGGANGWVLRPPGDVLSTVTRSGTSCGGCGHGYAMAGGEKLSGAVETAATEGYRARGERGSA